MKIKKLRRSPALIAKARWAAYAAAGAATALGGTQSLEAAIHYSGPLLVQFPPHKDKINRFPLDQAGDYIAFARGTTGYNHYPYLAAFSVFGIVSAAFRGSDRFSIYVYAAAKLPFGENISAGKFTHPYSQFGLSGVLASTFAENTQWSEPGIGFVGFRFNNGAGVQYGWARVRMSNLPENAFRVVDYAYADPGEPISAGQRSSDELAPDQSSLGWLTLGAVGLLAWRKSRCRAAH